MRQLLPTIASTISFTLLTGACGGIPKVYEVTGQIDETHTCTVTIGNAEEGYQTVVGPKGASIPRHFPTSREPNSPYEYWGICHLGGPSEAAILFTFENVPESGILEARQWKLDSVAEANISAGTNPSTPPLDLGYSWDSEGTIQITQANPQSFVATFRFTATQSVRNTG